MTTLTLPRIAACFPGAGSHLMTELGFLAGLQQIADVEAFSGTSAGGCNAVVGAFGVSLPKARRIVQPILQRNRVLDVNPISAVNLGLCAWQVVPRIVDELLGPKVELGAAGKRLILGVTDLDSGLPRYFDSSVEGHKKILVRDIVRVMTGIPVIAPMMSIPSWMVGTFTPSIQLHTDGGVSDNTVDHVFDDLAIPRLAIRLKTTSMKVHRVRSGDPIGQALGLFGAMLTAASTLKSRRDDGVVVDVPAVGDGLNFDVSDDELDQRWSAGYTAARNARDAIRAMGKGATT